MATSRMVGQVGRVVGGRYRLLAPLGTGASADVFVADDVTLRRRVAVKVLHSALAGDESFLRRFRVEARTVASLRHPNIMAVYDWGEEAEGPYLVLEFLGGGSLRDLLDRGHRLSPSQALLVGLEAARALDYAHRRGFVHRDIKPANLLFDDEGRVCIADFGIARALAEATWTEPTGAVVGTVRYASPEQARGNSADGRADVYGLALTLIEAVTGSVPFVADTTIATLMARLDRPIPIPDELGPLADALRGAAAVDPADRLDSGALVAALDGAARRLPRPDPIPIAPYAASTPIPSVLDPTVVGEVAAAESPQFAAPDVGSPIGPSRTTPGPTLASETPATSALAAPAAPPVVQASPRHRGPSWPRRWARSWFAAIAAIGGALLAGLLIGLVLLGVLAPKYPVPAISAADLTAHVVLAHHFRVVVRHVRRDGTVAGQLVGQRPAPGSHQRSGAVITVDLSDGPTLVAVPSVVHTDQAAAVTALGQAGLLAGTITTETSDSVPKGTIIRTSPAPGTNAPKGTAVNLVVSAGPIVLPELRGQTADAAQATIKSLGLTSTLASAFDDAVPAGQVVKTSPGPGDVPSGSVVTITVSQGPRVVTLPDLRGLSIDAATKRLQSLGLIVGTVYGPRSAHSVIATSPDPGAQVNHGSAVDLFAAR